MKLTLYTNTSDEKKVGKNLAKQWELTDVYWKEETDILHPVFTFKKFKDSDGNWIWKNFNYCMLEWSGLPTRYYFIDSFRVNPGGIIEIHCHVDVRETWKAYILAQKWLVSRQEHIHNPLFSDERLKVPEVRQITTVKIGDVGEGQGGDGSIILTVSG